MLDAGLVVGIQDLGAAGITGAASETASKGGVGMDLHLADVHVREQGMEPFEIMISESQERMLAIVEPAKLDDRAGHLRPLGDLRLGHRHRHRHGPLPDPRPRSAARCWPTSRPSSLDDDAPRLRTSAGRAGRPRSRGGPTEVSVCRRPPTPGPTCSTCWPTPHWVFSQYDHQLFLNTVEAPAATPPCCA